MEGLSYGFWLLIGVTIAYVGVAVDLSLRHQWPFAIVFAGYSMANVGMLWSMK